MTEIHLDRPMGAIDAIYQRRAVRAYTGERIDDATVQVLLRAAIHAPTAMHREPWGFVIVQDAKLLARINERAKALIVDRTRTEKELLRAPAAVKTPADLLGDPAFDIFYGAGTLIVICAREPGEYATADCWLAAENLMLAATAMGLGSCPIGFATAALREPDLAAELGIAHHAEAIAPIIVGRPRGSTSFVARRDPVILSWSK